MRLVALAALLIVTCGPATNAATVASGGAEPRVFVLDGGMATPLPNGGRVELANGWALLSFAPYPPNTRSDLDVVIFDGATGKAARADVSVTYDMIGMEHGVVMQRATPREVGHHRVPLNVAMPGIWRFAVKVVLEGTPSTVLLLLPEVR